MGFRSGNEAIQNCYRVHAPLSSVYTIESFLVTQVEEVKFLLYSEPLCKKKQKINDKKIDKPTKLPIQNLLSKQQINEALSRQPSIPIDTYRSPNELQHGQNRKIPGPRWANPEKP
jgi:hypothetical protein